MHIAQLSVDSGTEHPTAKLPARHIPQQATANVNRRLDSNCAMVELDGVQLFSKPVKSRKRRAAHLLPEVESKALHGQPATTSQQPLANGSLPEPKQAEQVLTPSEPVSADTISTFKSLGLSEWLEKLCKSLGMTQPTQVQTGCIPSILAGRDVIGTAHTGSGKTAAFALPILQQLAQDPFGVYALVLTPTRCADSMHSEPATFCIQSYLLTNVLHLDSICWPNVLLNCFTQRLDHYHSYHFQFIFIMSML